MNIPPVSFGRAVKIVAPEIVAQRLANAANASSNGTKANAGKLNAFHNFAESIFNDTHIAKAKVVKLDSGDIYIFSGEEAKLEEKLTSEAENQIRANKTFVHDLPDRYRRKEQEVIYNDINDEIWRRRNEMVQSLLEDGENNSRTSIIKVDLSAPPENFIGVKHKIDKFTYLSQVGQIKDKIIFSFD